MNRLLPLFFVLLLLSCSNSKEFDGFTIEGNISGYKSDTSQVILSNESLEYPIRFKQEVKNGRFVIQGTLDTPEAFYLTFLGISDTIRIFLDNSYVTINGMVGDLSNALIAGAYTNEIAIEHKEEMENLSLGNKIDNILFEYNSADLPAYKKHLIEQEIEKFNIKSKHIDSLFIEKYPKSAYSLYLLWVKANKYPVNYKEQKIAVFRSIPEFRSNRFLKSLEESVTIFREANKGDIVSDILLIDSLSNKIHLTDIYKRNKITLLYFWAGWCNACSYHNQYLKSIYPSFKWRGLEIVGVSLDYNKNSLDSAILANGINWLQYSDYKVWKSPIARRFRIDEIPATFLIGQDGEILSYKLDRNKLKQTLRENLLSPEELDLFYKAQADSLNRKNVMENGRNANDKTTAN